MDNIFLNNKYTRWYYLIINAAQFRVTEGYTEKHHIIPKSLGGKNNNSNLVKLTAKEHFICHLLLTKMVISSEARLKMNNAVWMMQSSSKNQERRKISSITYSILKKNISESYRNNPNHRSIESRKKQSATMKGRTYEEIYGLEKAIEMKSLRSAKRTPMSEETKIKLRNANLGKKTGPSQLKGRKTSNEVKQKISDSLKGRSGQIHTAESKKKISDAKKGSIRSEESKLRQSQSTKGKPKSPEHRAKIAEAARDRWAKKKLLL